MEIPVSAAMNDQRVVWAAQTLNFFQNCTGCGPGEESLRDLLADLRHWTTQTGVCWETVLATAMSHYLNEVEDLALQTDD